jgi:hypothetical protein
MSDLGEVFDQSVNPKDYTLGDIFEQALSLKMVPGVDASPTLGSAANYVLQGAALPGTLARKAVEKISPEIADTPLFPSIGGVPTAPIPGISNTTVAGGAEFAANTMAPSAIGMGEGLLQEAGLRGALPKMSKGLAIPEHTGAIETTAVDLDKVFDAAVKGEAVPEASAPVVKTQPLSEVFDEATNISSAKKGREFLSPEMQTPEGVAAEGMGHDELAPIRKPITPKTQDMPVVDPKNIPADQPFAVYRGSGFGGDFYDVYNSKLNTAANQQLTLSGQEGLKKIQDAGIPLVGKIASAGDKVPSGNWLLQKLAGQSGEASLGSEIPKTPEDVTDRLLAESKASVRGEESSASNEAKQTYLESRAADTFQHESFVRELPKMSPTEEEALQFSLSGSKVPKSLANTEVAKLIQNPTPAMKEASSQISKHYDELHQALVKRYNGEVGYRENYGPMFLNQGTAPKPLSYGGSELSTRNPNIKSATFPDLSSAMDAGYQRVNKSALDDLRTYHKYFIESENALDLKDALSGVKDANGTLVGPRHLMRSDAVRIEHPAFQHTYTDSKGQSNTVPLYARPDVYKNIKILLEKPFKSDVFDALQALNGIMKKAKLSLSAFHHVTLTENALTGGVMKNVLNPNDWVNALSEIGEGIKKGGAAFTDPKWTEIGLRNGLTLGDVVGAEEGSLKAIRQQINKLMKAVYKDAPEISFGDLEKGEAAWDAVLWKHIQPYFKVAAFKNNTMVALEKFPNLPSKMVMRQVANQINAQFGGAVWENVFENPNTKKLANFVTLALDWNYSNYKVLANSLSGGMNIERMNPFKDNFTWGANTPQGYLGRSYLLKSLLMFAAGTEAFNMATTKLGTGTAKPTWKNDEGQKMGVFLFRSKGKNYYLTLNKGLRDSFLIATVLHDVAVNNPVPFKHVIAKMSPIMHLLFEQMTGKSMTGYDMHFEHPENRYIDLAQAFLPMITSGNSFAGALPVSSGMSQTRFKEEFKYAYAKNDYKKMSALIQSASRNSVHWKKSVEEIKNAAKQEKRWKNQKQEGINSMLLNKLGLGNVPGAAMKKGTTLPTGFTISQIIGDALMNALKGESDAK